MKKLIRFALAALFLLPSVSNAAILTHEVIMDAINNNSPKDKAPRLKTISETVQQTIRHADTLNLKSTSAYKQLNDLLDLRIKNNSLPANAQLKQLMRFNNELDSIICAEEESYMNKFRAFALSLLSTIKKHKKKVAGSFAAATLGVVGYIYRQKLSSFAKSLR